MKTSASISPKQTLSGLNPRGKWRCRTKESCQFSGSFIPGTPTCWKPPSMVPGEWPRGSENHCSGEKAPTSRSARLATFDGKHAVIGSWVIGHEDDNAAGMGIRESDMPIITNTSQFVPHLFG